MLNDCALRDTHICKSHNTITKTKQKRKERIAFFQPSSFAEHILSHNLKTKWIGHMYLFGGCSFFSELMTCLFISRFYIESISYLKDNATIELFFLNAKSCIYKVSAWNFSSSSTCFCCWVFIFWSFIWWIIRWQHFFRQVPCLSFLLYYNSCHLLL